MNGRPIILALLLLVVSVVSSQAVMTNISPNEAKQLLDSNKEVYLLDVRTPQEYMELRIDGAKLIPIDQFQRRVGEVPRNQPVLVYCAVGSRSAMVADYLSRIGYPQVYNMTGGVYGWKMRNLPVLSGPGG